MQLNHFFSIQKNTNNYTSFSISLNDHLDSYSNNPTNNASITFANNTFSGVNLTENGFSSFTLYYGNGHSIVDVKPQTINNYSLNGIIYPLAQTITNDSTIYKNTPGVYKVIYSKNAGIIEFETNPGGVIWIKQQ